MKYNKKGNMVIESGYSRFDKQSNCVVQGNAICSTQVSGLIRSYEDTENCCFTFQKGELLESDLGFYKKFCPYHIIKAVREYNKTEKSYLYVFFITEIQETKNWGYLLFNYDHTECLLQDVVGSWKEKKTKALNYLKDLIMTKGYLREVKKNE